jgi:hypothetical protein
MSPRFLTILTGNLPKIRQPKESEPSTINKKTLARNLREPPLVDRQPWFFPATRGSRRTASQYSRGKAPSEAGSSFRGGLAIVDRAARAKDLAKNI